MQSSVTRGAGVVVYLRFIDGLDEREGVGRLLDSGWLYTGFDNSSSYRRSARSAGEENHRDLPCLSTHVASKLLKESARSKRQSAVFCYHGTVTNSLPKDKNMADFDIF